MRMKPDWLNDSSVTEVEVVAKGSYIRHIMVLQPIARGQVARTSHDTTAVSGEKNESRIRQSVVPIVTMRANWRLPKSGCQKAMGKDSEYPTWQRSFRSSLSKGKPCTWQRAAVGSFNTINGKCEETL